MPESLFAADITKGRNFIMTFFPGRYYEGTFFHHDITKASFFIMTFLGAKQ
jgi:hypothetical protein